MVRLYVGGKKVDWADAEKLFADLARTQAIEFLDDAGKVIATSVPGSEPIPAWEETYNPGPRGPTPGEFLTFDEWKKRLGWE